MTDDHQLGGFARARYLCRSLAAQAARVLPRGGSLPPPEWRRRHAGLLAFLWVNVVAVPLYGITLGDARPTLIHALEAIAGLVLFGALGATPRLPDKLRSIAVALGLLTATALAIEYSGGLLETHFYFFVMIILLTLYEDWLIFLIAVGFVLVHHGVLGTLDPRGVFDRPEEWAEPWKWASIHAAFVAAAGAASIGAWRLNEDVRSRMLAANQQLEQMELELRLSQKLESVGQLAAGVAHEINTPVQYVGTSLHFLREAFGDVLALCAVSEELRLACEQGPVPSELLERVRDAGATADLEYLTGRVPRAFERSLEGVRRVSEIVGAMREFAHPPSRERAPVDLAQAIEMTLIVAAGEYKHVADVVVECDELPPVVCNQGDVNQVFLNLVVNAAHAMADKIGDSGERGTLTIRGRREGDSVVVSFADTGGGVPADVGPRMFDPFFTTKHVGRGTGQGLAIARVAIVEGHGGTLTFTSEPGQGAIFSVSLPLLPADAAQAGPSMLEAA